MLFCAEVFKMFFMKVGLFGLIICVYYPLNSQDKGPTAGADCTQGEGTFYWLAGCSCHCFSLFFSSSFSFFLHQVSVYHGEHWATGLVSEKKKKNHVHLNEVFPWGVQHRRDTCAAWPCISIGQRTEAKTERLEVRWLILSNGSRSMMPTKEAGEKRCPETCKKGRWQVLWEFK